MIDRRHQGRTGQNEGHPHTLCQQSDRILCNLIAENPHVDQAYTRALADVRKGYVSQERAKSAIFTLNQPFSDRQDWTRSLIPRLEALLINPISNASNTKSESLWDNIDRLLVMGTGEAFLGGSLVQIFGGGWQLIGAIVGFIVGIIAGIYVSQSSVNTRRNS